MSVSEESKSSKSSKEDQLEVNDNSKLEMKNAVSFGIAKKEKDERFKQINVDPGAAPGLSNHYPTIGKALDAATPYTTIKITSGNYPENVTITKPNITLEPKEKCGEVTIYSHSDPCLFINLPDQNDVWVINFIKIKFTAPTKKEESKSGSADETNDPKKEPQDEDPLMLEQFVDDFTVDSKTPCIINIKRGTLKLIDWKIDFEGSKMVEDERFPCILGQKGSSLIAESCTIKGDSLHEANTTAWFMHLPNYVTFKQCLIEHHLEGGIILNLDSESKVEVIRNEIRVWQKAAIYIQGEDSIPTVQENYIKICLAPAIVIGKG